MMFLAEAPEPTVWEDLLSVILYGTSAGVGVALLFAVAIRGLVTSAGARREGGHGARAVAWGIVGIVGVVLCIAVAALGVVTMLHR